MPGAKLPLGALVPCSTPLSPVISRLVRPGPGLRAFFHDAPPTLATTDSGVNRDNTSTVRGYGRRTGLEPDMSDIYAVQLTAFRLAYSHAQAATEFPLKRFALLFLLCDDYRPLACSVHPRAYL